MTRRISAENIDPTIKALLKDMAADIAAQTTAAVVADLAALRVSIVAITAKLDLDAGVTDTNYAATTNPAAMTATASTATVVA